MFYMKFLKYLFLILLPIGIFSFYVFYHNYIHSFNTSIPSSCSLINISGISMQPTIKDKSVVKYCEETPKTNDIVIFQCNIDRCEHRLLVKRIIDIKHSCYFFEGDNSNHSTDSRVYGWLCDEDLSILGIVHL